MKTDNSRLYSFRLQKEDTQEHEIMESWIFQKSKHGQLKRASAIYQIMIALIQQYAGITPKAKSVGYTEQDIRAIVFTAMDEREVIIRQMIEQLMSNPSRLQKVNELTEQYQTSDGSFYDKDTMDSLLADFEERE